MDKICSNSWVVIRREKNMKLIHIKPKQREYIARIPFTFEGAIGHNFGTSFEIVKGQLMKADPKTLLNKVTEKEDAPLAEETVTNGEEKEEALPVDNRNLHDRDDNQRLGRDDIEEMRARGARGHEIVGELVSNSLTFKEKTEYSRAKYVDRKKKKHFSLLTILKPSTRILCEMYYSKGPAKLCGLRLDSLTQMLLHANVRAGAQLMVVESALGMVLGAVMERMGGDGALVHLFGGSAPQKPAYFGYNFPESFHEIYYEFPLSRVVQLFRHYDKDLNEMETEPKPVGDVGQRALDSENNLSEERGLESVEENILGEETVESNGSCPDKEEWTQSKSKNVLEEDDSCDNRPLDLTEEKNSVGESTTESLEKQRFDGEDANIPTAENRDSDGQPPRKKFRFNQESEKKRKCRVEKQNSAKELMRQRKMDGLIFCSKYHPTPIVVKLIELIAPSRPLVVFNQFREPLIDLYNNLKTSGKAVNLKLSESWMREYQVLPGRTRPMMQMSGGGGFLLTGFVVEP